MHTSEDQAKMRAETVHTVTMTFGWLLLSALAAVIAGAIGGVLATALTDPNHRWRGRVRPVVVGLCAILAVVAVQAFAQNAATPQQAPPAASQATGSSGGAAATTRTDGGGAGAAEANSDATNPDVMEASLLDLPHVEVDTNEDADLSEQSSISINGTTYDQTLIYSCYLFCDGSSPQTRTFVLGKRYKQFTAVAAVLDSASGNYKVDVTCDQAPPRTYAVSPAEPAHIKIDVSDVSRLRVRLYANAPLKNPAQAGADTTQGENGGGLPGIALGDPTVQP